MELDRRKFLARSGWAVVAATLGGSRVWLTPREARARGVPTDALDAARASTLTALGELLVPGSDAAGLVPFVDSQLSIPAERCALSIRYTELSPPYAAFYRDALAALDAASRARAGRGLGELDPDAARGLVAALRDDGLDGWTGPAQPLVYRLVRSDAVDVVYGTREGFERLGLAYMPHVDPPKRWPR